MTGPQPARVRRRWWLAGTAVVAVLGIAGALIAIGAPRSAADDVPEADADARTAVVSVERTDLAEQETFSGTIGFGATTTVAGPGDGTVTWLPGPGAEIARGKPLFRVDDRPVVLFLGDTPFFRTLELASPRLHGNDVRVLAENLRALGYEVGRLTPAPGVHGKHPRDIQYTPALSAAVEKWQRTLRQEQTGVFDPASAVVLPEVVRVEAPVARLGDSADGDVLRVSSTHRSVRISVPVGQLSRTAVGDAARIAAGADEVAGTVAVIAQGEFDGSGGAPPRILTIAPEDASALDAVDAETVRVTFTFETRKDVLAVPVEALLALRGGGYGLEREDGTLVGVTTGLFANGRVEVSGAGVEEGLRVVSAS